jgi:hypothetical protein
VSEKERGKGRKRKSAGERCGKSEGEQGKDREGGGWAKIQREEEGEGEDRSGGRGQTRCLWRILTST